MMRPQPCIKRRQFPASDINNPILEHQHPISFSTSIKPTWWVNVQSETSFQAFHDAFGISRLWTEPHGICADTGPCAIQERPYLAANLRIRNFLVTTPVPFPERTVPPVRGKYAIFDAMPTDEFLGAVVGSVL